MGTVAAQEAAPGPRYADPERRRKLEATFARVDEVVEAYRKDDNVPGLVVAIVVDGELAHAKGFGLADVASGRVPDLDTRFRVASISKSFTALVALRLRDEGKLSLDDSRSQRLRCADPGWASARSRKRAVPDDGDASRSGRWRQGLAGLRAPPAA